MKKFENVKIEIIRMDVEDVIRTSGGASVNVNTEEGEGFFGGLFSFLGL